MKRSWIFLLILVSIIFLTAGCSVREPILIGMAVELSGSRGKIGVTMRNGAQLAVADINAAGGINGRQLELIVRDDEGCAEVARRVDQELIDLGVVAIIGHVTSQQTEAVYEMVDQSGVILFSPTSSSPYFTGKVDNFFRVMPDNQAFGQSLGWVMVNKYGIQNIVCVLDSKNKSFVDSLWRETKLAFESGGGEVLQEFRYDSNTDDLSTLMEEVAEVAPEGIVFVASDTDTALMAQYGRLQGIKAQYFSSTWAQTDELISKGGAAVEGMVLSAVFNQNSQEAVYLDFFANYVDRFKIEPGLGATHTYETVMVLAEGLKQTDGELDGLAEALASIQQFQGVQGDISFNMYGDVLRESYFVMVKDREFVTVEIEGAEGLDLP